MNPDHRINYINFMNKKNGPKEITWLFGRPLVWFMKFVVVSIFFDNLQQNIWYICDKWFIWWYMINDLYDDIWYDMIWYEIIYITYIKLYM